jgi:hypothetical protein
MPSDAPAPRENAAGVPASARGLPGGSGLRPSRHGPLVLHPALCTQVAPVAVRKRATIGFGLLALSSFIYFLIYSNPCKVQKIVQDFFEVRKI